MIVVGFLGIDTMGMRLRSLWWRGSRVRLFRSGRMSITRLFLPICVRSDSEWRMYVKWV